MFTWLERAILTALLAAAVATAAAAQRQMPQERIGDGTMVTVLPQDAIAALSNPTFLTRQQAEAVMADDEPVLGLVDPETGQAKAYSLWHLDRHEIVNDTLGGKPIAVTW